MSSPNPEPRREDATREGCFKTPCFVTPARPGTLGDPSVRRFTFRVRAGGLLVAFTDGVDECHYANPQTSIRASHHAALFAEVGPNPRSYVRRLAGLALSGVDGNPGGEDNLAIVAATT